MRLIRRFRAAFGVSVAATIVSILLAVAGGGPYKPDLAVLTATLVALIWYTFFTYCALFRVEEPYINYDVRKAPTNRTVEVVVSNPTRERRIAFTWRLTGWRNGAPVPVTGSLVGGPSKSFTLRPGESRSETVVIDRLRGVFGSDLGPSVAAGEPEDAIIRLDISWRDDLGETHRIEPDFWAVNLHQCTVHRYQDLRAAQMRWAELGGPASLPPVEA